MLVETKGLSKRYGSLAALVGLDLRIQVGEIFGLLGPNGSGKTTLLRLLMGFLRPSGGSASIAGIDCTRQPHLVHQRVSYLPGDARLFPHWRGRDVLEFFASARGGDVRNRSLALAERLELDLRQWVVRMSSGMRQKLALCVALAPRTQLLVLDEPTTNLDPTVRQVVIDLVRAARADEQTVIFSSHVLDEVETACDRVGIMRCGQLAHMQAMEELRSRHRATVWLEGELPPLPAELAGRVLVDEACAGAAAGAWSLQCLGPLAPVLRWLATLPLADVRIEPYGLRSVYDRIHRGTSP